MYEKLASVKEIVDLSSREALDSAQAFLTRQGYRVVQRTDESLTVNRPQQAGTSEGPPPNLTVVAPPEPEGGVKIRVSGTDREGMRAGQAEWKRWADGLPKIVGRQEPNGGPLLEQQTESRNLGASAEERQGTAGGKRTSRGSAGAPRSPGAPMQPKPAPQPTAYEYQMVQIPPTISVQASQHRGDEAAQYMQSIANSHAEQGWEFYRVDTLSVAIPPGCLSALFGDKGSQSQYYVMTFRRAKA